MLDNCSETCGWIAGLIAAVSFGSFGVPIKATKARIKVDPLVMQSYKSVICFLTCWLVIPLGVPFSFTPWGIVSGLFWVPGATAGIYGIQNAGLAISVGTWSSLIVMSSFCWGILVFGESVKSKFQALIASCILIVGLVGMSFYSAPTSMDSEKKSKYEEPDESSYMVDDGVDPTNPTCGEKIAEKLSDDENSHKSNSSNDSSEYLTDDENGEVELTPLIQGQSSFGNAGKTDAETKVRHPTTPSRSKAPSISSEFSGGKIMKRRKKGRETKDKDFQSTRDEEKGTIRTNKAPEKEEELIHFFGKFSFTKRQLGLIGAIINGVWGSNNMIPMHYARSQGFHGPSYLISYSVGSMIITILLWVIRILINFYRYDYDHVKAYNALPSFHFRILVGPGSLAGFLYSLGNFCSIITVTALGQGVGYSFVQTSMLISGLWGIFHFGEVKGTKRILKWMMSSFVTLTGILYLSYEHQGPSAH
jgi:glucose uptake protein GlcU